MRNPSIVKNNDLARYRISLAEFDKLLKSQNSVCAICLKFCSTGKNLGVDHDHRTGKVRGLLCQTCNSAIGMVKESLELIDKMKSYLLKHKGKENACEIIETIQILPGNKAWDEIEEGGWPQ
jgi:hypothetical protein